MDRQYRQVADDQRTYYETCSNIQSERRHPISWHTVELSWMIVIESMLIMLGILMYFMMKLAQNITFVKTSQSREKKLLNKTQTIWAEVPCLSYISS